MGGLLCCSCTDPAPTTTGSISVYGVTWGEAETEGEGEGEGEGEAEGKGEAEAEAEAEG